MVGFDDPIRGAYLELSLVQLRILLVIDFHKCYFDQHSPLS